MADLTWGMNYRVDKENLGESFSISNVTADMAVTGMYQATLALTTATQNISTATLSSVGLAFMRNLSTATVSTIQVGVVSGTNFASFCTLKAGEAGILRLTNGNQYQARGSAATDRLRVDIIEG